MSGNNEDRHIFAAESIVYGNAGSRSKGYGTSLPKSLLIAESSRSEPGSFSDVNVRLRENRAFPYKSLMKYEL